MKIVPVRAFQDNYIWLLQEGGKAVCVDPGEAGPVLAYLKQHGLALEQIWITHHHHDHIGGIAGLLESFPQCRIFGNHDIGAAANLRFAAHIEPENQDIARAVASEKMPTLPVRLEHECKVNPFLRVHVPAIARRVEALSGKALHNDLEVFAAMRELKNRF